MSIGSDFERSQVVAIGRFQRNVKSVTLRGARDERKKFLKFYKATRLSGPTTPPHPAKGDFSSSGRIALKTGRTAASLRPIGIAGTNVTPRGRLSIRLGIQYGRGVIQAQVHERGRPKSSKRHTPARTGFRFESRKFFERARRRIRADVARVSAKAY